MTNEQNKFWFAVAMIIIAPTLGAIIAATGFKPAVYVAAVITGWYLCDVIRGLVMKKWKAR